VEASEGIESVVCLRMSRAEALVLLIGLKRPVNRFAPGTSSADVLIWRRFRRRATSQTG
jgi:hypothetical protein